MLGSTGAVTITYVIYHTINKNSEFQLPIITTSIGIPQQLRCILTINNMKEIQQKSITIQK